MAHPDAVEVGRVDIGRVRVARTSGQTVVWLSGEHDIGTADALSETLANAIAFGDDEVIVDLGDVQFMDATSVGVFVRAHLLLRARAARSLILRSPSSAARRILQLCDLDEVFGVAAPPTVTDLAGHAGS